MIFATVGTQLPFDRMLYALDDWAGSNPSVPVFAQIGTSTGTFRNMETVANLGQSAFHQRFQEAKLIVAHAGMGTILSAAELGKPIILMPRRFKFGEHRNDHQQDTATEMARLSNVTIADEADALHESLDWYARSNFDVAPATDCAESATLQPLLDVIRAFVWDDQSSDTGRAA